MNKNIILAALQSQLETVKASVATHEQDVYQPAVAKLTAKITEWFATNVISDIYSIEIASERIVITPADTTAYGSTISIDYRGSWRGDAGYFESSAYRPDLKSNEDNTLSVHYYQVMAAVACTFSAICDQYKAKWMPAHTKLINAKSDLYNEIYKIEREIRSCESEIAELEKEKYNQAGFECVLADWTDYNSTSVDNDYVYVKKTSPHQIKAHYGRGRWDCYYINSFKVLSFPKAKHSKVVLEYKQSADEKVMTAELSKQRYAEFINDVYSWQTSGAATREANVDERVARYNKVDA
jgi:hypothetical protein